MTPSQSKFLKNRLNSIIESKGHSWTVIGKLPKPAAVKRAEIARESADKIIKAHDRNLSDLRDARSERIRTIRDEITQIILFGNAEDAIKALDRLENTKL
jgi:hypothetical protein